MPLDLAGISLLIPLLSGAIVSVIHTFQQSRCKTISLCCGCLECIRNTDDVVESTNIIPPPEPSPL